MVIMETTHVRAIAEDWEIEGDVFRNNIGFETGNWGLLLVMLLDRPRRVDSFSGKMRSLDLGSILRIEIGTPEDAFRCSFDNAVLTSKQGMCSSKDVPNPVIMSAMKKEGYAGIIQLAFHVGPVLERQ